MWTWAGHFFSLPLAKLILQVGMKGVTGNKGAVAVRFDIFGSSCCFVCAHLAAGQSKVELRNSDYQNVTNGIAFRGPQKTILDHDLVVWLGDFNYRINLPDANVRPLIPGNGKFTNLSLVHQIDSGFSERRVPQNQLIFRLIFPSGLSLFRFNSFSLGFPDLLANLPRLLEFDQLKEQQKLNRAFVGFSEGPIAFPPTYRFDVGTNDYDTSEKRRTPAWCDRVLYRVNSPGTWRGWGGFSKLKNVNRFIYFIHQNYQRFWSELASAFAPGRGCET